MSTNPKLSKPTKLLNMHITRIKYANMYGPTTGDKIRLFTIRIGDADEFGARQSGEHARMIAAHDANTDDTHT